MASPGRVVTECGEVVSPWGGLQTTRFRYDAANRLTAVKAPDGGSVYFAYDAAGNGTREQDALTNTTYYEYDSLNRVRKFIDPLARSIYYEYDENSNLTKRTDEEAREASFEYTARNERRKTAYSDGVNCYYTYDEVFNVSEMNDSWGKHRYSYDALNRMNRHEFPASMGTAYFSYDTVGIVRSLPTRRTPLARSARNGDVKPMAKPPSCLVRAISTHRNWLGQRSGPVRCESD